MLQVILLSMVMSSVVDKAESEETALYQHRIADADVLANLHRNRDCSSVVRAIDLRFVGAKPSVTALNSNASDFGFTFMQTVDMQDGEVAVDFTIEADTYPDTIDNLTIKALKIEQYYSVRYDGWGTIATKC